MHIVKFNLIIIQGNDIYNGDSGESGLYNFHDLLAINDIPGPRTIQIQENVSQHGLQQELVCWLYSSRYCSKYSMDNHAVNKLLRLKLISRRSRYYVLSYSC